MAKIQSDQIEVGAGPQHVIPKYGAGPGWELEASRLKDDGTDLKLSNIPLAPIYRKIVDLIDAQIKALPGGEDGEGFFSLVAAPGANKVYNVIELTLISNFVSVYANVSATAKLIGVVGPNVNTFEEQTIAARNGAGIDAVTNLLTFTARNELRMPSKFLVLDAGGGVYGANVNVMALGTMIDRPIGLYCLNPAGNFTGGHVDNTLRAIVRYSIDDV